MILAGPAIAGATHGSPTATATTRAGSAGRRSSSARTRALDARDELRAYPKNLLQSPLDVRSAVATLAPGPNGAPPTRAQRQSARRAPDRGRGLRLRELIVRGNLSFLVILASLAVALFWGAAHALSPGPRQVDRRRLPRRLARHAPARALLGLITTVTHTIGVFALGAVTLSLSQFIVPDQLYPWLNLARGALIVAVGLAVLPVAGARACARARHARAHHHARDG